MTVVRLFVHFFDSQRQHDDRMPCTTYSVSSVFAHGDALNSSILTDQRDFLYESLRYPTPILFWKVETRRKRVVGLLKSA